MEAVCKDLKWHKFHPFLYFSPSYLLPSLIHSDPGKSGNLSRVSSSSSAVDSSTKHLLQKKQNTNSSLLHNPHISSYGPAPRSPSSLPRSYTTSTGAGSRDSLLDSQHLEVERKKEVFLDHLRQKYPHHAAIIMGHHDHMMEQVRSEAVLCSLAAGTEQKQCSNRATSHNMLMLHTHCVEVQLKLNSTGWQR